MFSRVLIANRGEIACRVIRTCRRLGITAVAVYSEADADAQHVALADEAIYVGPPPAADSYLQIDRIVDAARSMGVDAVHPGYGFLSENAAFAAALDAAGITFIGPPVRAIEVMGDKIESKRLATSAGVSTVPGHPDPVSDPAIAAGIASEIGYPVMIKAAAGGGGKGMRVAYDEAELRDGLVRASSEARSSFGDDRVFLEKFIEEPRHIEIQILGDQHGGVIYLGERECSIQRRHQKVIEEAPSPFLDGATRQAMGEQATALARAVDYHSAGTVEFIVDAQRHFYFLEMNTRLQVEHPVTELVTGLDLVEQMIRVAAGEPLGFTQADVRLDGWALEARVYAEDPARGFLPSVGRLKSYIEPVGDGIRIDSGVVEGSEVALFYDPMIAKVCSHGADRPAAIARLAAALDELYIRGPHHNVAFLAAILQRPRFRDGQLSTNFIAEEFGDRFVPLQPEGQARVHLAAVGAGLGVIEAERNAQISGQMSGWQPKIPDSWSVSLNADHIEVGIGRAADGFIVDVDGERMEMMLDWWPGRPLARAAIDDQSIAIQVDPGIEGYRMRHRGLEVQAQVRTHKAAEFAARMPVKVPPDTSKFVLSPMPGLMVSITAAPGDPVKAGPGTRRARGDEDGECAARGAGWRGQGDSGRARSHRRCGRGSDRVGMKPEKRQEVMRTAEVSDELRARVHAELPEVEEITDAELRAGVIEAWALALAKSSFNAIADIEPSGNPGVNTLKQGSQTDHIRGVTRLALKLADEMCAHDAGAPDQARPADRRCALSRRRQALGVRPREPQALGGRSARCRATLDPPSGLWRAHLPHCRPTRRGCPLRRRPFGRGRAAGPLA